jgi:ligand-binding sensor domain-containing protein
MARNRWIPAPALFIPILLLVLTLLAGCGPAAVPTQTPLPPPTPVPTAPPVPTTAPPAPTAAPAVALGDEMSVDAGGYAFRAIPDYIIDVDDEEAFMLAPDADWEAGPFFILTGDSLDDAMTLDEAYDLYREDLAGAELGQPHDTTVGGAPARIVDLRVEEEGVSMSGRLVLAMPHSRQVFALLGVAPPERWDGEAAALFDAVLASVRFFTPVPVPTPTTAPITLAPAPTPRPTAGPTVAPVSGLAGSWTLYTNANYVRGLAWHDGRLWAATAGGVAAWDPDSGTAAKYTTADGLLHDDVQAIISCPLPEPRLVVGTPLGLSMLNPDTGRWETLFPEDNLAYGGRSVIALGCAPASQTLLVGYGSYGLYIWDYPAGTWRILIKKDGLGSDMVSAIGVVGDMEEVWVGAVGVVSRITAEGITVYTQSDSALLNSTVTQLLPDDEGGLWLVQYSGNKLVRFDGGAWMEYSRDTVAGFPSSGGGSGAIAPAGDGTIWVVSASGKVCRIAPDSTACLEAYEGDPAMVGFAVNAALVDPEGHLYFGNRHGQGISAFDGSAWQRLRLEEPLVENNLQVLGEDTAGRLWVGTRGNGLQWLDPADPEAAWEHVLADLPSNSVRALTGDPAGGMWVGHSSGASYYDGTSWTHWGRDEGILPAVQCIAVDGRGRTWFGTYDGISIWDGQFFTTLTEETGLPGTQVRALVADGDVVWAALWGTGVVRFEGDSWDVIDEEDGLPNDDISALALDRDGALLVGCDDTLVRLDAAGQVTELYQAENWSAQMTTIAVAPDGTIWVGDLYDGAYYYDGSQWHHVTTADGLPTQHFYEGAVLIDHLGTAWFAGLEGGLAHYVP